MTNSCEIEMEGTKIEEAWGLGFDLALEIEKVS